MGRYSQLFNEIMPCIYQRFTEKEARQWRQIYKSLVLLEYVPLPPRDRREADEGVVLGISLRMARNV
jgi:epsin